MLGDRLTSSQAAKATWMAISLYSCSAFLRPSESHCQREPAQPERASSQSLDGEFLPPRNLGRKRSRSEKKRAPSLLVSRAAARGDRSHMEDTNVVALENRFLAVFDGHGGADVSKYLRNGFYAKLAAKFPSMISPNTIDEDITKVYLEETVNEIDTEICAREDMNEQGSTAVIALIGDEYIWTVNVGDSRAFLCSGGSVRSETKDHKPDDPMERQRIESVGGKVIWVGWTDPEGNPIKDFGAYRMNGNLAVARSIGDKYERPYVTSTPDIVKLKRDPDRDDFMVLASDGLWDVMDPQDVLKFVRGILSSSAIGARGTWRNAPQESSQVSMKEWTRQYGTDRTMIKAVFRKRKENMAEYLVEEALNRGSCDNITVVIVFFH